MSRRIAILQGHPDPAGGRIDVARLEFALLHNAQEWEWKPPGESIVAAQQAILWAEHLAIFYPLWLAREDWLAKLGALGSRGS